MIFANAVERPLVCSRISNFFSGGWTRSEPPSPVRTPDAPKIEGAAAAKPADGSNNGFDQGFIDKQVTSLEGPGHASGQRQPGQATDTNATASQVADYREANRKKWQTQKDAEARDKLFGQPTPGRVDGQEVPPFSSRALEENAADLSKASGAESKFELGKAYKNALVTSSITLPVTIVAFVTIGTINETIKPHLSATPAAEGATAAEGVTVAEGAPVDEGKLVDRKQASVFQVANTLANLRGEGHVGPSDKWAAQTDEERLDSLDAILDYCEPELVKDAQKYGVKFQPATSGGDSDDIKTRTAVIDSRLAALTALFGVLKGKVSGSAN